MIHRRASPTKKAITKDVIQFVSMFKLLGVVGSGINESSCALLSNYTWGKETVRDLINTRKDIFYRCSPQAKKKNGSQGVWGMIPLKLGQININWLFLCIVKCRIVQ